MSKQRTPFEICVTVNTFPDVEPNLSAMGSWGFKSFVKILLLQQWDAIYAREESNPTPEI